MEVFKFGISLEILVNICVYGNFWNKFEFYKVKQTGEVSESTWRKEYGNMIINDDGTEEPKGKTYPKLIKVADSQDANSLLINIGKFNVSGSDYRIKRVQIIRELKSIRL